MEKEKEYVVWVDLEHHVISFHPEIGFTEFRFPTQNELLTFAVEVSENEFFIQ